MKHLSHLLLLFAEKILAAAFLVCLLFPILTIAAIIYTSAGKPVFVRQNSLTSKGTGAGVWHFRTSGGFGRFLHNFNIDAFPAWWNVIRGNISIKDFFSQRK